MYYILFIRWWTICYSYFRSWLKVVNIVPESRIYHKWLYGIVWLMYWACERGGSQMHCSVRTWELWVKISTGPHPPYCHGGRGVSHSCLSESDSWRGNGVAGNPLFLIRSISQWWALKQVHPRPLNLIMVPWEQSGCHNTRISNTWSKILF